MKHSNEIENIFQKLKQGESKDLSKKESIWNNVEQKLDAEKTKKKKLIPFPSIKTLGIAASIALLFAVGFFFFNEQGQTTKNQKDSISISKNNEKIVPNSTLTNSSEELFNSTNESQISNKDSDQLIVKKQDDEIIVLPQTSSKVFVQSDSLSKSSIAQIIDLVQPNTDLKEVSIPKNQINVTKNVGKVKGFLEDEFGPVSDAEVMVRGDYNTIIYTDESGKFEIDANIGDVLAVTDAMGNSQDYKVNKENLGRLKFGETIALESVTIVGGIKMNESQKVGSYSVVKSKNVQNKGNSSPIASVDQVLNGRVAGLNFSNNNGQPGNSNSLSIRGVSSLNNMKDPLYVIDGIVIGEKIFKEIDPQQIESITVVKEQKATSLYGSRGVNGVIIIETKNGLTNKQKRELRQLQNSDDEITEIPMPQKIEVSNEEYSSFEENKFESPKMNPLSTFSVDVDKAAYSNIRRFLNNGQSVPKDAVRIEEMINYFSYQYPQVTGPHPFSIHTEYSDAPWNPGHKLVKIGIQGKNLPAETLPNSNLVFLIDVSGSMEDPNKLPLLKKSFELLVNNLREKDKVSIVVYAGAAGMVLPPTSGNNKQTILEALNNLSAGGSTAGAAGIELAYQLAEQNFIKDGNNRVILATDGDFNVGTSAVKDLEILIAEKRKTGIFLTCLGYGMGNYKDNRMETLSNKGNGNYAYIDNLQEANKFLVKEFSGTLYAIAKDVKIQIEFNPNLVQAYRLIGYETRLLNDEDFINDAIDAGEIGAGHQVTAMYEIIPTGVQSKFAEQNQDLKYSQYQSNDAYQNELATVKFRYKNPDGDKSIEIVKPISNQSVPLNAASNDFKLASSVAWFGLKLRDSELIQIKETSMISELAKQAQEDDKEGYKAEFVRLVDLVK